ncbi:bifunctional diguanylate cyclase/phosphodiesterase [Salinarimonas soli]|uniref:EAL domain-containing protein n=1 Tax=Salinarimonas soli TaxID=1638099 RepID=A0A5B2VBK2_9HYPH|nr:EAL domain-containing protein [Salinarimonas soli]KAA2236108.1 EAL domain-containing protein [Salinarimonas soli]
MRADPAPRPRDATDADLATCANEPIHIPGAIQPHGALVAADAETLRVTHVSANLGRATGVSGRAGLGRPLAELLGADAVTAILAALSGERYSPGNVLTLDLPFPRDPRRNVMAHRSGGRIVVEIEPASPEANFEVALARAQAVVGGLRRTGSLGELCDRAAREIRALTGYDRVMVYRFNPEGHGQVVAEDRQADLESFLDLRYPATDIPAQARRLYLLQRVRTIGRVDYEPVPVLADAALGDAAPLDMSYCALRSVSPVHLEYLANMGVGATFAISIVQDETLWGMVVCHHGAPRTPSADMRALCDLIGQLLGLLVGEAEEREDLRVRMQRQETLSELASALEGARGVADGLAGAGHALLRLVDATGAFVRLGGRIRAIGATPPESAAERIFQAVLGPVGDDAAAIEALGERSPDLAGFRAEASGVLALPVANNPGDGVVWFRPEVARTVTWGGDPGRKAEIDPGTGRLSPRKSFAAWTETVRGRSLPWSSGDRRAAADLRRLVTRALLRQAEAELMRVANIDPLTGLPNRRLFEQQIARWRSGTPPAPAALLFFDLDRFKTVNDSLGHAAGDELLVQIAGRLGSLVGPADLAARIGGDEFVVFCEGADVAAATALAERIIASFDEPLAAAGRPHRAAVSVGIACASASGAADLLRDADAAMYAAKRAGGNRAVVFQPELQETALRTFKTEQDLFYALDRGELVLFYQPIVALPGERIIGFEALIRWHHPERGWITPAEFIPRAEETGLIGRIGQWVVEEGLRELAAWPGTELRLSVNVSPRQLSDGALHDALARALEREGVEPGRIILEVTEGALMDQGAVRELARLRELGCLVAVDDFGTGYSSLAYLQRLPIDVIKIDREFVSALGEDPKADRFMRALVGLAHTLELRVVAEGVETAAQRDALTAMGCETGQGYLFSRPVPSTEARALIAGA